MCRLIESIKIENRKFVNMEWHNKRFNEARSELFDMNTPIDLSWSIIMPRTLNEGVYKCRMVYGRGIERIDFQQYTVRPIKRLKLVEGGTIDYHLKYEDRSALNSLMEKRGDADDILIVKDGYITDTSYSNIACFDGEQWFTPDTFLLNGTQRQYLLSKGILQEKRITSSDLQSFTRIKPINAMLSFEETECVEIIY